MRATEMTKLRAFLPGRGKLLEARRCSAGVCALLVLAPALARAQTPGVDTSAASTPSIVQCMVAQNARRAHDLHYLSSQRHYHIDFHGLGRSMTADMHVQATYVAGSGKTFRVLDESGSHVLINHVLKKLLETERDDSHQQASALTPANYRFDIKRETNEDGHRLYVVDVDPKAKNKLLYRGTIQIDAQDCAVTSVEAEPAENPSFWIRNTQIHHVYSKDGEFWLPQSNRSESKVRFGGTAILTIDYGTYDFHAPNDVAETNTAQTKGEPMSTAPR